MVLDFNDLFTLSLLPRKHSLFLIEQVIIYWAIGVVVTKSPYEQRAAVGGWEYVIKNDPSVLHCVYGVDDSLAA